MRRRCTSSRRGRRSEGKSGNRTTAREQTMRTRNWLALGTLLGVMALVLTNVPAALSQKPAAEAGIPQQLAKATKLTEEQAAKFYAALGPILSDEIRKGKTVSLPG